MTTTQVNTRVLDRSSAVNYNKEKSRINFVDGLRGIAAVYVLIAHASNAIFVPDLFGGAKITGTIIDRILDIFLLFLQSFGHYAVVLFIVISGYSLMLGVVRAKDEKLSNGTLVFLKRRAIRLLPTYYAAFFISVVLLLLLSPNVPTVENIITHIFLVQNWFPASIYSIDGPMWSLAVEWQIYFLFPFLLIPIWKRFGSLVTVVIGITSGVIIQFIFDSDQSYIFAWFIGLFALGMLAASVGFTKTARESSWKKIIPWGGLTLFFIVVWGIIRFASKTNNFEQDINWYKDIVAGIVFCCLLVYLTNIQTGAKGDSARNILFRLLSSRLLTFLGSFSYSIYLIHAPILFLCSTLLTKLPVPAFFAWCLILFLGVPVSLICSYFFYLIFEKPFLKFLQTPKTRPSLS
ncbi:MAG: acyltransferase [Chloroflexi bacterium]|nr:acyltransferase [Chloroflexota bacterium]OJV91056.1 MAG: hypothetical protein BGO39_05285 [Chloroflexi bacterium 54-19]